MFEGWADSVAAAAALVEGGAIELSPCHHHAAVGPMAGIISPSMPVFVVENRAAGNRAYSNMNEGLGKVLRFGAHGPEVIERLRFMADVLAPALRVALARTGPIELKPLMAQALNMGDEVHNRNAAATSLLFKRLAPALIASDIPRATAAAALDFIAGNDHFFLNLSMAACKAMLDAAANVPGSSLVTAMARNGVNFGIRLAGTGDTWFEAPANPVDGLYFPGYSLADAAADLGDSAITETAGVGGFAMAAAPAIVQVRRRHVGGCHAPQPADARDHARSQPVVHAAVARLRRGGGRHRRAQGRRPRHTAGDQQRHCASRRRRRADRRRGHDGAARRASPRRSRRWPQRCRQANGERGARHSSAGSGAHERGGPCRKEPARRGRRRRQRADPRQPAHRR